MAEFFPIIQVGYERHFTGIGFDAWIDYKRSDTLITKLTQKEKEIIKELLQLEIEKLG